MGRDTANCWCNYVNGVEKHAPDGKVHAAWCAAQRDELAVCPECGKQTLFGCERDGQTYYSCIDVVDCGLVAQKVSAS